MDVFTVTTLFTSPLQSTDISSNWCQQQFFCWFSGCQQPQAQTGGNQHLIYSIAIRKNFKNVIDEECRDIRDQMPSMIIWEVIMRGVSERLLHMSYNKWHCKRGGEREKNLKEEYKNKQIKHCREHGKESTVCLDSLNLDEFLQHLRLWWFQHAISWQTWEKERKKKETSSSLQWRGEKNWSIHQDLFISYCNIYSEGKTCLHKTYMTANCFIKTRTTSQGVSLVKNSCVLCGHLLISHVIWVIVTVWCQQYNNTMKNCVINDWLKSKEKKSEIIQYM